MTALAWAWSGAAGQCDLRRTVEGDPNDLHGIIEWFNGEWLAVQDDGTAVRWNGAAWTPLPSFPALNLGGAVRWHGGLVISGRFGVDALAVGGVRFWDGSTLSRMGPDMTAPPLVFAELNGELYGNAPVGGEPLVRWTGAQWEPVLGVGERPERADLLTVSGGEIYMGSTSMPDLWGYRDGVYRRVAAMNGARLRDMRAVEGGVLVAGVAGQTPPIPLHVALWNGASWESWDGGLAVANSASIFDIRGVVHLVGDFGRPAVAAVMVRTPDGGWAPDAEFASGFDAHASTTDLVITTALDGYRFGGPGRWSTLRGPMLDGAVYRLAQVDGGLYAGGTFTHFGDQAVNRVARRTEFGWAPLGDGLTQAPTAMAGSLRIAGNGGLFSFTGWFWSRRLGRYRAFVTDPARSVVLKFSDRTVVVSPDVPEEFVAALRAGSGRTRRE